MRNLFRVETVSGGSFYVVAESYADAHDLFKKMVETNEREVHSYYKIIGITHLSEEIYFYPNDRKNAVLYDKYKQLILPDSKPKTGEQ